MTDKKQPEALRLADALERDLCEYPCDAVALVLRRQHAENTTLQAGYAAARLEIESLKAQPAGAQQPGAAYAALSDAEIDRIVPALEPVSEDFPVEWALWKDRGRIRNELRASHGQAPAPPHFGDEAHVAIPQMLLCAACSAIDKKRDGTKVLAELRRYTTGDLSQAIAPAPAAQGDALDTAIRAACAAQEGKKP